MLVYDKIDKKVSPAPILSTTLFAKAGQSVNFLFLVSYKVDPAEP